MLPILSNLVVASAIYVAATDRKTLTVALILGVPAVILTWVFRAKHNEIVAFIDYILLVLLYFYIFALMLRKIVISTRVSVETVILGISSYLLLGLHSDQEIRELKGGMFPLLNLEERLLAILGVRHVDDVLLNAPWRVTKELLRSENVRTEKSSPASGAVA